MKCLKEKERKSEKRKIIRYFDSEVEDAIKNKKIKTMIDFDKNNCNSIKSIIVNGNTTVDVSTRFIKGKMFSLS